MNEAAGNLGADGMAGIQAEWAFRGHAKAEKKGCAAEGAAVRPFLPTISGPEKLRELTVPQLRALAAEIRDCLLDVVSRNGGHLSSNLGVVELTIALHRFFDFKKDRLIFDVGHQAYVHKLLTGRYARFHTLRKQGGICGYPDPKESEYDVFLTGHAGTAISSALGLAVGYKTAGAARKVVAVVGDGAMTCGMSLEALNHAGAVGADLLVVLNDNEHSISRTTGALSRYLSRVRSWSVYNEMMDRTTRLLQRLPLVGRDLENIKREVVDRAVGALTAGALFEEFGFRYYGPVDGHDFDMLFRALRDVSSLKGPVLLHVMTQKGRGFAITAGDPVKYHSPSPFVLPGPETRRLEVSIEHAAAIRNLKPAYGAGGKTAAIEPPSHARINGGSAEAKADSVDAGENRARPYTEVMMDALIECARADRKIVAITAAMPTGTGLAMFAEEFPDRYYDVGICEPHAVTFAAGLAKAGLKPVVCIYSTFMQRAADNLMHDISLQGGLPAVFLMDRAGLVGTDGATHHGLLDLAYTTSLPHFVCMAPKDAVEAPEMLRLALSLNRPVAIRYPRDRAPERVGSGNGGNPLELGRGEVLRRGRDVAVLAYGASVVEAMSAAEDLAEEGIEITVADAKFAKPLDAALLGELLAAHEKVITVEEHQRINGFGSMAAAEAAMRGMDAGKLFILGVGDEYVEHGPRAWQLARCGLDAAGIAGTVRRILLRETPAG